MTDMLDKCAKAIFDLKRKGSTSDSDVAASVIRALMEPTPEMVEAAATAIDNAPVHEWRLNLTKQQGFQHQICRTGYPDEVLASCTNAARADETVSKMDRTSFARASVVAALRTLLPEEPKS